MDDGQPTAELAATEVKRVAVAKALFANLYLGTDNPGFPARLWEKMPEMCRAPYYQQADAALSALQDAGFEVRPKPVPHWSIDWPAEEETDG